MEDSPKKRKYRRGATLKQIRAVQYKNQGMTTRQAMLKAGYSLSAAANPKRDLLNSPAVKQMIHTMWGELTDAGLTSQVMVEKFKEWLNAQKVVSAIVINGKGDTDLESANSRTNDFVEVPDYKTQLEAYKEWKKIADADQATNNPSNNQVRRKLTIEEYVSGESTEEGVT